LHTPAHLPHKYLAVTARQTWPALRLLNFICLAVALSFPGEYCIADVDLPTKFSNNTSISNTRHNLTQRQASGGPSGVNMDPYRNDYGQICVYCHTPHGANPTIGAPLWNRTLPNTSTFTTYSALNSSTLTQTVTAPGANSLVCLSCHDGATAVDATLNMPGPGSYSPAPNAAFLNTWSNPSGLGPFVHLSLKQGECLACHAPDAGVVGTGAADFTVAVIGKDLTDDHPVGIGFPASSPDFVPTTGNWNNANFFDLNGNGRMEKNEIRVYDTGEGYEVECTTCHDPHGVPSAGAGSPFIPTFMRVANNGSNLCITCHIK